MSYDNTNSGTLGKNRYKEQPNHPDVKGMLKELDDEVLDLLGRVRTLPLAGWTKTSKDGERFVSLTVDMHYLRKLAGQSEAPEQKAAPQPAMVDDDIPF